MITDDELIDMIRNAATEQLPIAVMTVNEMRQFAQKVAMECALISAIPNMTPRDITRVIKERYGLDKN
jgi:hypothetical protein